MSIQVTELRGFPGKPRRFSIYQITNVFELRIGQIMTLKELHEIRSNGVVVVIK